MSNTKKFKSSRSNNMKIQIKELKAQIADLQAFCGVLAPVFEKEYRRQKLNWEADKAPAHKGRRGA